MASLGSFIEAGKALGRPPKSLLRMLSQNRSSHVRNLLEPAAYFRKACGAAVEVRFGDEVTAWPSFRSCSAKADARYEP